MALGHISISIFLFGCVGLILSALVLVRPRLGRERWQRVLLAYVGAGLIAAVTWGMITWRGPWWVAGGLALFCLMLIAGIVADIKAVTDRQRTGIRHIVFGNVSRSVALIMLALLNAILLGRTAMEIGLTNNMPLFYRTATEYQLVVEYDGQEYPAHFLQVQELGLHVWVPRHELMPRITPFISGARYDYPQLAADLPFDIYMTANASWGRMRTIPEMAPTFGNIAVVYCSAKGQPCFRTRPEVKEQKHAQYGNQLSGKGASELNFQAIIPGTDGQDQVQLLFSFKDIGARPIDSGPFASVPEIGNIWLLSTWDWFTDERRTKCNNHGLLAEWRLCNISNDTWEVIRHNQAKPKQADQSTAD